MGSMVGLLIAPVIITVFYWIWNRRKKFGLFKRNNIPGPKPNFKDGNMLEYNSTSNPNRMVTAWINEYGDVFGFYYGEVPIVVVKDLEILRKIFIKDFQLFANRPKMFIELGIFKNSIFAAKDKKWKEIRSIVSSMFTPGKLKLLTNMVISKVDFTVDLIEKKARNGELFDVHALMQGLTLDVIGSAALALKMNCQENQNDDILKALREIVTVELDSIMNLCISFQFLYNFAKHLSHFSSFARSDKYLSDHLESVIKERRRNPNLRGSDFLQSLIDRKEEQNAAAGGETRLSTSEIVANAYALFTAGYETTSTSLAFTFYLLVKHPKIQQRLYEEIRDCKDSNHDAIQSMQYLDQVYSEALRIYPPVTGFMTRATVQDYAVGAYTIPKDCEIMAPVWDIHHDPDLWPDPWTFDPDRFSPENRGSINSMAYIPFGVGPRNCVGARMAQLEAKITIFKLLRKFRFEKSSKFEDPLQLRCPNIITYPANGVWLKASIRA